MKPQHQQSIDSVASVFVGGVLPYACWNTHLLPCWTPSTSHCAFYPAHVMCLQPTCYQDGETDNMKHWIVDCNMKHYMKITPLQSVGWNMQRCVAYLLPSKSKQCEPKWERQHWYATYLLDQQTTPLTGSLHACLWLCESSLIQYSWQYSKVQ